MLFQIVRLTEVKMDSNNDGYISPKEMKEHYKKVGSYKWVLVFFFITGAGRRLFF